MGAVKQAFMEQHDCASFVCDACRKQLADAEARLMLESKARRDVEDRLRETEGVALDAIAALRFYANKANVDHVDGGKKARACLRLLGERTIRLAALKDAIP